MPRDYDREWTVGLGKNSRLRQAHDTDQRDVTRFLVQLEYRLAGEWATVVRFDHDPANPMGHDVTTEGVHLDVYRDGEKVASPEIFPPMGANDAYNFAEGHMDLHAERYIERFEQWHL